MSQDLKTILVVDDEQNIRFTLRSLLETDGFSVREAATSGEAIDEIERSHPALVLLDLWLPGSDGMTVLEHLNQQPPRIRPRVVVLTAHGKVPVAVKAMRLGASDFLEKPTTPEDLRLSIAAALEDVGDEPPEANPPVFRSRRAVHTDRVLARIRHAVWNQDIRVTENVLSALFRKARDNPANFNLVGAVFEAEGNLGAARTFYTKAANASGGCGSAGINLLRLQELEAGVTDVAIVDLGDQETLLENICGVMQAVMPKKEQH
jgi:FixJ family two-component response regulator